MPIEGEYEPSTWGWVADQVERYEASGGTEANTLMDTGIPIIVMTTVGHKSGKVRKVPLMRVEHEGEYGIIASKGGNPTHPGWYYNLLARDHVTIQDGPEPKDYTIRELEGEERDTWYARGEAVYPDYTATTPTPRPVTGRRSVSSTTGASRPCTNARAMSTR
ncbi:MAG: nitroreductase family deazaflavin-dependent oxidoreductase [Acidimicrobiia bacterium]|nr:nitroreductase family deazaflavin-dependent oxidoreductase [Acidimicrobiia bacterium]